jgi:hypothetical protein
MVNVLAAAQMDNSQIRILEFALIVIQIVRHVEPKTLAILV